jgi:DmsE family decaheme c-type cytochrome
MNFRSIALAIGCSVSLALLSPVVLGAEPAEAATPVSADLPRTDMNASADAKPVSPYKPAPGFMYATIPENPLAPDAKPVGEEICQVCHVVEDSHFSHTLHANGLRSAAKTNLGAPTCEACHGPGSAHWHNTKAKGLIIGYTKGNGTPIDVQQKTCLGCHAGGAREYWGGSVHQRADMSCSDCHNPMQKASAEGLEAKNSINETCANCHRDIRAQFNRRSHMPLPEGQISCVDCHNPHGSRTAPLLKTNTVNETCYQCHAEKRGPFLFEHPPVKETCLNCHTPHGSNQQTLLFEPIPFICENCHTNELHMNKLNTTESLATGAHPDERMLGRGCLTCHANIHGSNAPAGSRWHE